MASTIESQSLGGFVTQYDNINFSTAKQKYSFGKGPRFPSVMAKLNQQIGYELPSTINKRAAGFGVGNRFHTPLAMRSSKLHWFSLICSLKALLLVTNTIYPLSSTLENREQQIQLKRVECTPSESVASITRKCMCQKPSRLLTTALQAQAPMTPSTRLLELWALSGTCKADPSSLMVSTREIIAKLFNRTNQHQY